MATVTGLTAAQTQALLDQKAGVDHTHDLPYIVLGAEDPVPPETPAGMLIFRTEA